MLTCQQRVWPRQCHVGPRNDNLQMVVRDGVCWWAWRGRDVDRAIRFPFADSHRLGPHRPLSFFLFYFFHLSSLASSLSCHFSGPLLRMGLTNI